MEQILRWESLQLCQSLVNGLYSYTGLILGTFQSSPPPAGQKPAEEGKYNQLYMHVCTPMCTQHCGGTICRRMRQKITPGKRSRCFVLSQLKWWSSSDYCAWLKLKRMLVVGFTIKSTCILLKNISSWHVVVLNCPRNWYFWLQTWIGVWQEDGKVEHWDSWV